MFKRSPSLTEQIKSHIKEQIVNNEFEDGRIPSETEMANELGVSRTTIRDALSRLEIEGAIVRKQGAGTFVNEPILQIQSRLDEIWSYTNVLEAHGYTPTVQVIDVSEEPASAAIADELGLAEGDKVLVIKKRFLEDDTPVMLARNWLPASCVLESYKDIDFQVPIYDYLEACSQQRLNYYLSDIVPVSAEAEIAAMLQVPSGTALLALEEVGYNENNEPILKAQSYFRDDLLRFRLIRRRT